MKTTGGNENVQLNRKRSATVALQEIVNENCYGQEHPWTSKSPNLISPNNQLRSSVKESSVSTTKISTMNTDTNNNNNAIKEEEVILSILENLNSNVAIEFFDRINACFLSEKKTRDALLKSPLEHKLYFARTL